MECKGRKTKSILNRVPPLRRESQRITKKYYGWSSQVTIVVYNIILYNIFINFFESFNYLILHINQHRVEMLRPMRRLRTIWVNDLYCHLETSISFLDQSKHYLWASQWKNLSHNSRKVTSVHNKNLPKTGNVPCLRRRGPCTHPFSTF